MFAYYLWSVFYSLIKNSFYKCGLINLNSKSPFQTLNIISYLQCIIAYMVQVISLHKWTVIVKFWLGMIKDVNYVSTILNIDLMSKKKKKLDLRFLYIYIYYSYKFSNEFRIHLISIILLRIKVIYTQFLLFKYLIQVYLFFYRLFIEHIRNG